MFTREESAVIVDYLQFRQARSQGSGVDAHEIDAALELFWMARAHDAPTEADLAAHVAEEARFAAAIRRDVDDGKSA